MAVTLRKASLESLKQSDPTVLCAASTMSSEEELVKEVLFGSGHNVQIPSKAERGLDFNVLYILNVMSYLATSLFDKGYTTLLSVEHSG